MQNRLRSLDGLRGAAALVVLLHHVTLLSPRLARAWYGKPQGRLATLLVESPLSIFVRGTEAVWIFFLLSGYVLTRRQLAGERIDAPAYYWRRACRLYIPMAASVILAIALRAVPHRVIPGGSWWLNGHAASSDRGEILSAALLVFGNKTSLNTVWWSLQWEAWFSLAVPILVLLCRPVRRHLWIFGVACVFTSSWLAIHWSSFPPNSVDRAMTFMPMFGAGVALAAYEPRLLELRRFVRGWRGWFALAAGALLYWSATFWKDNRSMLPFGQQGLRTLMQASTLLGATGILVLALGFTGFARLLSVSPAQLARVTLVQPLPRTRTHHRDAGVRVPPAIAPAVVRAAGDLSEPRRSRGHIPTRRASVDEPGTPQLAAIKGVHIGRTGLRLPPQEPHHRAEVKL